MSSELLGALFKRRSNVDQAAETWESCPSESSADASHLAGLNFNAPPPQEWLQGQLEDLPEEDLLADVLAEGLAERGDRGPAHMPPTESPEDRAKLKELAAALAQLQRQFAAERSGLGEMREELARQEAELKRREAELKAEEDRQRKTEDQRRNYPQPKWLENVEGTMNIAVVGNAGVGKSLLINRLRNLRPHAKGWAPVGVNETTLAPTMYPYPGLPTVRLWDLPGAGTEAVPAETYVQDMGLRYFDHVLVATAGRFTSMEAALRQELQRHGVPHFMVRTKVDIDVWNNKEDNGADEATTLREIIIDLERNHGVKAPYLISSRDVEKYDFPRLMVDLFPGLRKQLDPSAPSFCPAWADSWALPQALPPVFTGLQGTWRDNCGATYIVQGEVVHVSVQAGNSLVQLREEHGQVSWMGRWYITIDSLHSARRSGQLRWIPVSLELPPVVWWWCG